VGILSFFGLQTKNYGEYYVYALIDPRTNVPFYLGKGSHDRMYQHQRDMERLMRKGTAGAMMALSCKHKRIRDIIRAGYEVKYEILYRTDEEGDAYRAERQAISDYGLENLTNETYGLSDRAIERLIRRRVS
jgi:hypothetical protein